MRAALCRTPASERERALRPLAVLIQLVCHSLDLYVVSDIKGERVDRRYWCSGAGANYRARPRLPARREAQLSCWCSTPMSFAPKLAYL